MRAFARRLDDREVPGRFNLDNNLSALDGFNKETTIATRLQNAGYATAQFGKWHLGPTPAIPSHGFKHTFSQNAQRPFSANITLDGKDRPMGVLEPEMYHVDGCSRAAASIIERYKEQPFFLYIAYRRRTRHSMHLPIIRPGSLARCRSDAGRPSQCSPPWMTASG